ncbi:glycosyltransferase family 1 protein [Coraliomargarita algicola]|uniref:Glycosyltransferase family 1 protein n=1 Tax=Coraliomargarita algicola TaxID=3092156 RepID=A0ABZ0RQF8_9BACT|nr:glycosyltransferase family 1 protein [Coraliomargarita sp. J2-16]WPJ97378.1 glycosyltransferase family 1 protein [Coraliomargarita sp. J2-16]
MTKPKSNLHINARFLGSPHQTGTHRSSTRFLQSILKHSSDRQTIIHGEKAAIQALTNTADCRIIDSGKAGKFGKHFYEQFRFPTQIGSSFTLHMMNTGPFILPNKRQILIIHDLNPFKCKDSFSRQFRYWNWFACKLAIKRSFHIISFSRFVSDEIRSEFNLDASQVSTIYQGPGLDIPLDSSEPLGSQKKNYFLCVGSLQPHKNLPRILEAWTQSRLGSQGFSLKIIGKKQAGFQDLLLDFNPDEDSSVEFSGYVTDKELMQLYQEAQGLIYPSIEEGFGLPIVEAFKLGCPVITSNRSCLPEIAGDAALLVDPYQVSSITAAIVNLANNSSRQQQLIRAGSDRASIFNWDKAGRDFWQLLEKLNEMNPVESSQ